MVDSNILSANSKFIASQKELSNKDGVLELEIVINPTLQKEIYEEYYKEKSKEVEIKGFRKGMAPRNLIESEIYDTLKKATINQVINQAVREFLNDEKNSALIVLDIPEVSNLKFSLIETPITFTVKLFIAPEFKLPDISKYKVSKIEVEPPTEDEIKKAMDSMWEMWKSRAKKEDIAKFAELNDDWVREVLKTPELKTVEDLKKSITEELEHNKLHSNMQKKFDEAMNKLLADIKITLPKLFVETRTERDFAKFKENIEKQNSTIEKYAEQIKKSVEQIKKDIEDSVDRNYKEELFWIKYIKERDIKVDPKDDKDTVFLNYAASQYKLTNADMNEQTVYTVLQLARKLKASSQIQKELGIEHKHNEESHSTKGTG